MKDISSKKRGFRINFKFKMFWYCFIFSRCSIFDLSPPFNYSSGNEFENWIAFGPASPLRNSIRFLTNNQTKSSQICQLLPTYSNDWNLTVNFSLRNISDQTFSCFSFSKEICPSNDRFFKSGFSICAFNQSIYLLNNSKTQPTKIINIKKNKAKCKIPNSQNKISLFIDKKNTTLKLLVNDQNCFVSNKKEVDVPSLGFFSFFVNGRKATSYVDLESIIFHNRSVIAGDDDIPRYRRFNKKLLTTSYDSRRESKKTRRNEKNATNYYLNELKNKKYLIDGENAGNLMDAFTEISELMKRAKHSVDYDFLETFVNVSAYKEIMEIQHQINITFKLFNQAETEYIQLKKLITSQFQSILIEANDSFSKLKENSQELITSKLKLEKTILKSQENQCFLNNFNDPNTLRLILLSICIAEVILFIFIVSFQRKKSKLSTKCD